jgi:hypothetical protein
MPTTTDETTNMGGAVAILFLLSVWPTAILQLGKFKAWLIRCINITVDIASCLAYKHIYCLYCRLQVN